MSEFQFFQLAIDRFRCKSLGACLLIVVSQKWHGGLSHDHDLNGVQKVHTTAVPRIGGLSVLAGIVLGCLGFQYFLPVADASRLSRGNLAVARREPAGFRRRSSIEDFTKRVSVQVRAWPRLR